MRLSAVSVGAGPGRKEPRRAGFRALAAVAAGSLLLASAGVAYADDIYNTIDSEIDAEVEVMPLNVGADRTTTLQVRPGDNRDDPLNGCNLRNSGAVTLDIVSSPAGVVSISPARVTIEDCGAEAAVNLTVTGLKAGSATVTASVFSHNTTGTFNMAPATFEVNVSGASNEAPEIAFTGVEDGASFAKGSAFTAVCNVTDKEDGPSSFDATLGQVTGPDAATGIGTQKATCSYTDKGGLTVTSSVTYYIIDDSAPTISYSLSPANPDGLAGWYKSAVQLTWIVTDADSPSTVRRETCVDELIEEDQVATTYSCSATSGGGIATWQTEPIKMDGTAPIVSNATGATGTLGNNGWYTSIVEAFFTATDATSGLTVDTKSATSEGQGPGISVASPAFTDVAGNSSEAGAVSQSFDIDWTAPDVTYVSVSPAPNANGWYKDNVVATFAGSDLISGLASPATLTATSAGEGSAVVVDSPVFEDMAGNTRTAKSDAFKIDKTAPTAAFDSVLADSYFGSTPAEPSCTASDLLSGPESCVVSNYKTTVGTHILTATATDKAGNTAMAYQTYTVKAWTLKGFYQPIDMGGIVNTVKGGSTVPAKFEVFVGDTEITDASLMKMSMGTVVCEPNVLTDAIETTVATGATSLRYDATAGQFIYNWKTPTGAGTCYQLTMKAPDGSTINAKFKLK